MYSSIITLLVLTCNPVLSSSFHLFLKASEVKRLLGLNAELQYVKDGEVNSYALGFEVIVHNHISDLFFTWQGANGNRIAYSISITFDNHDALTPPQLNITRRGYLPIQEEVFKIVLLCTGKVTSEVEVLININITLSPPLSNTTSLVLKRKKICYKAENDDSNGTLMLADAIIASSKSFYIGVGCASAVVVLLTSVAITTYFRSRKVRRTEATYGGSSPGMSTSIQGHAFLRADTPINGGSTTGSYSSYKKVTPMPSVVAVHVADKASVVSEPITDIHIERQHIVLQEKIQEGTFSQTYSAIVSEDMGPTTSLQTFIKTVTDQASQVQVSLMLAEGMMMMGLNHKSILPLIGLCTDAPKHPMLVYPYLSQGNLKKFLHKCKFASEGHCHAVQTQDLVAMAIQLAQGVLFLHKNKIIHRDIATRNCMVDDWFQVKITDSALSRDLFPNDYHCLGDNENRPIKWLAYESLMQKEFSSASDVWAFGVTLWELMTLGQQPYVEIDPFEIDAYLRDGYRLAQPINCPDELFAVMACCWMILPEERPVLENLISCLQNFYSTLRQFI